MHVGAHVLGLAAASFSPPEVTPFLSQRGPHHGPGDGSFEVLTHDEQQNLKVLGTSKTLSRLKDGGELGMSVVVLGAGVGGLTTAFQLLNDAKFDSVTVLEARDRIGGRCTTLRPGDSFTEMGPTFNVTQTVTFDQPKGDTAPYLNAGPGRIPSAHRDYINYAKLQGVPLELYQHTSYSNLIFDEGRFGDKPVVHRRLYYDSRGAFAAELYAASSGDEEKQEWLREWGALQRDGTFTGTSHSGYVKQPSTIEGVVEPPLPLKKMTKSKFWENDQGGFYHGDEFDQQPTSFQPVGGMDMICHAFAKNIVAMGGEVLLSSPVTRVEKQPDGKWKVSTAGGVADESLVADIVVSNVPIALLEGIVQQADFSAAYWAAFSNVFQAYRDGGALTPATKVGWQSDRSYWQDPPDPSVVPIFGGISWTTNEMTQMWYPSTAYHDKKGVLTGAYNDGSLARRWGAMLPSERMAIARAGAAQLHGDEFAEKLDHGLAIAWQNIPYLRGGWTSWSSVPDQLSSYNTFLKGEGNFYSVGDQNSLLSGWQQGAVYAALSVVAQILELKHYNVVNSTKVPEPGPMGMAARHAG